MGKARDNERNRDRRRRKNGCPAVARNLDALFEETGPPKEICHETRSRRCNRCCIDKLGCANVRSAKPCAEG